jgi:hypothetical protein
VTAGVRIEVEDDEIQAAAVDDEVLLVVLLRLPSYRRCTHPPVRPC